MISVDQAFFALIRVGIGHQMGDFPEVIDWDRINALADEHGLSAIVWDAADQLMREDVLGGRRALSREQMLDGFGAALSSEQRYEAYKDAIASLSVVYSEFGLRMMVLKGYALSLDWPIPSHRPCGDIDVYLFGQQVVADKFMEEQRRVHINCGNPHHSVFSFEGFTVENHATFLDNNSHKSSVFIEGVIRELLQDPQPSIEVGGQKVFVPSVKLNSIYLLRHMANHFATEKITLRQLLDWAFFVEHNAAKVNWEYVKDFAKRTNMHKFLSAVNTICVRDFGFKKEHFPVPYRDDALATRVLNDILDPEWKGEIPSMREKLRYGLAKTRRLWHNRWKYRIVYDETLWESFWSLARNRVGKKCCTWL